jgi:hypothetical protein
MPFNQNSILLRILLLNHRNVIYAVLKINRVPWKLIRHRLLLMKFLQSLRFLIELLSQLLDVLSILQVDWPNLPNNSLMEVFVKEINELLAFLALMFFFFQELLIFGELGFTLK